MKPSSDLFEFDVRVDLIQSTCSVSAVLQNLLYAYARFQSYYMLVIKYVYALTLQDVWMGFSKADLTGFLTENLNNCSGVCLCDKIAGFVGLFLFCLNFTNLIS